MTHGQDFEKKGKCNHVHCSPMSNSALTDLNTERTFLKLHDKFGRNGCECQKLLTFSPKQYQREGGSNEK